MCGLAALLLPRPGDLGDIAAMTAALEARGPDDCGFLVEYGDGEQARRGGPGTPSSAYAAVELPWAPTRPWSDDDGRGARFALGHRRLAIVDTSAAGHQPMTRSGRYLITYNGEVYNYVELRRELEERGCTFRTSSDTEVVLAAWETWGADCLTRLVGMFAFVIVDTERRTFAMAVDPFGIKPLHYSAWRGGLAVASTIQSLLTLPDVARVGDPQGLFDYLRHGWTDFDERTLLAEVQRLPAGCWAEGSLDAPAQLDPQRYWRLRPQPDPGLSRPAAAARLRELFLRSVELHLRSDVTVGTALSGGIDSSGIVGAIRHLRPQLDLHTFSYVAADPALSEERWASAVAEDVGALRHLVRIAPGDLSRDLDRLIAVQDQPFGSTSMYAQLRVFERARQAGVPVLLNGQGGDELLAGYLVDVLPVRLAEQLRTGQLVGATRLLRAMRRSPGVKLRQTLARVGAHFLPPNWEARARRAVGRSLWPPWLAADWFRERGVTPWPKGYARPRASLRDNLQQALELTNLPMLLRFDDRNSMACSVESRVPFLTTELAEFLASLPPSYLLDDRGVTKAVYRDAMRGIVPDLVLDRPDKVGFATPMQSWLEEHGPWVDRVLGGAAAERVPGLRPAVMQAEWRAIRAGGGRFDFRVWRWVNLLRWIELTGVSYA